MDFSNRGNRPQQQQPTAPAQTEQSTNGENQPKAPKKMKKSMGIDFGKISSMVIVFGVAIIAAALVVGLVFGSNGNPESERIKSDKYQAVAIVKVFKDPEGNPVLFLEKILHHLLTQKK